MDNDQHHEADSARTVLVEDGQGWVAWLQVVVVLVLVAAGGIMLLRAMGDHARHEAHAAEMARIVHQEFGMPLVVPGSHVRMSWTSDEGVVACRYVPTSKDGVRVESHFCVVSEGLGENRDLPFTVDGPDGFTAQFEVSR